MGKRKFPSIAHHLLPTQRLLEEPCRVTFLFVILFLLFFKKLQKKNNTRCYKIFVIKNK
jgi:hypothetical protein